MCDGRRPVSQKSGIPQKMGYDVKTKTTATGTSSAVRHQYSTTDCGIETPDPDINTDVTIGASTCMPACLVYAVAWYWSPDICGFISGFSFCMARHHCSGEM